MSRDLLTGQRQSAHFDAVLICNGHFSVPNVPAIPGRSEFAGTVIHSHNYRLPQPYTGRRVILLGARASGIDISVEVAQVADKVYLSHNLAPLESEFPANVRQVAGLERLSGHSAHLRDGSSLQVDDVILCTGYKYEFGFLSPSCGVRVEDGCVSPIYRHLIHTRYPRMAFIGLPFTSVPFPLSQLQVQYFLASLCGRMQLPDRRDMDADQAADLAARDAAGQPRRHAHYLGPQQWGYMATLAAEAGVRPLQPAVQALYEAVADRRHRQPAAYKQLRFRITADDQYVQLVSGEVMADLTSKL